jgi:hypothetical protein
VLKEVQQVQFAPVEQTPVVLADLDPLDSATQSTDAESETRTSEALDRLYRPQALDVPVLVARDAPISTLDPSRVGSFQAPSLPQVEFASAEEPDALRSAVNDAIAQAIPQVLEDVAPNLVMVAVRPSWVRVQAADGTVIFEGTMDRGQSYEVPLTEEPPTLRAGESGAIYFAMNGAHYGPVGKRGQVTSNLPLTLDGLEERYQVADLTATAHTDLAKVVAEAQVLQSDN